MSSNNPFDSSQFGMPSGGAFAPLGGGNAPSGFGSQPGFGMPPRQAEPKTMVLGVLSLGAGVMSLFSCCCAYVSIPLGLAAVVLGIFALRGDGRIIGGVGTFLGGSVLLMTIGMLVYAALNPRDPNTPAQAAAPDTAAFNRAQAAIISGASAKGNSPAAIALAKDFSRVMKSLRDDFFTPAKKGDVSLSGGEFITWCELHEGSCVFLVHVPSYRKFSSDAKESLNELAWASAQQVAWEKLAPGDTLGLGMKGVVLYDIVRLGELPENPADDAEITYDGKDSNKLIPFFAPEAEAQEQPKAEIPPATDGSIQLPDEPPPAASKK